jgi:hypothetical protein
MVVVARIERPVAGIAEVAFRDNPKRPDRRERAAVFAVELVRTIAVVQHDLALEPARQIDAFDESVAWVPAPVTISIPLAPVVLPLARVVIPLSVVDAEAVTRVVVTVTWIELVEHTLLLQESVDTFNKRRCLALVQRMVRVRPPRRMEGRLGRSESGSLGSLRPCPGATTSGGSTSVDVEGQEIDQLLRSFIPWFGASEQARLCSATAAV